ncbi:F1F0 ATP synthase subunit f KNAG_0C04830 [Huiozyma naganishii CBS 8797]|uniref:Uncharacterized protein n=1 Tax=Huiozyma naganishii (strain ATCC MYA-139 / BCRC 22969 / CBS 8797 / KCTC 17520 / NBRC 10181 / NCYC 3082 / Yp74L-3) TaxID=1071383 RepID=J7S502_HUIN7|nr:hypothetical protein KNAG_0C04830 [Kazachstania naganishii CBS 8797]CCK69584.1 hypothetical protein KNAG_0C04830 [Kazachstania naganishii CBS 8797]
MNNFVVRRSLSTLIPPKVVSASQLSKAPNAKRVANMVNFYQSLPQGPAPKAGANRNGIIGWYKAKYFDGENASGKPLMHLALSIVLLGYSMEYYFHLRHHKNGASEAH